MLGMAPKTLTWYEQRALSGMHATRGPDDSSANAKALKQGMQLPDAALGKGLLNVLSGVALFLFIKAVLYANWSLQLTMMLALNQAEPWQTSTIWVAHNYRVSKTSNICFALSYSLDKLE